ncbi:MAG: heavy metal translocating P-type ATPase [Rickettsiales bacterium]
MGCEIAYKIIASLHLDKYYEYCNSIYNSKPMKVIPVQNNLSYADSVTTKDGVNTIHLIVEGITCGSCVWLIENTLRKQEDVVSARVNLSTKRLTLAWRGSKEVYKYINLLEKIGYRAIPFENADLEQESKEKESFLLKCMIVAGVASMSIMMVSLGVWGGIWDGSLESSSRAIFHIVATLIAVPAVAYSGRPFFYNAIAAIKARRSNMNVPISLAIIVSTLISIHQALVYGQYTYYDAAVSLIFFLLIGRYLELKARIKAQERANTIILSQPKTITLVQRDKLILTSIKNARVGDIALISAGDKIPVDGIVIEGTSQIDNSLITGETLPSKVTKGVFVNSGTINLDSPIRIRITRVGDNTTLGEILKLMEIAEQGRAKYVRLADRVASYYTPFVIIFSTLTFILWIYWGAGIEQALLYGVSVMIITCPCALGLAVPVVQIVASSRLMAQGILPKTADALERLAEIDAVAFDKTGTLTLGKPLWKNPQSFSKNEIAIIAMMANTSKHPLCQGITQSSTLKGKVIEIKGQGLTTTMLGKKYLLGSYKFTNATAKTDSQMEMWFKVGNGTPKRLLFEDKIKVDARTIIAWLAAHKLALYLISGDRLPVVKAVASRLNLKRFFAEKSPVEKYNWMVSLQEEKVLMVGDGLNDSAALRAAHVSMSPSSALDIAQNSADIVFQGERLMPIKEAIIVARESKKLVMQNFAMSLIYNALSIPFAMFGYATPVVSAVLMSASSLMVIANALRLRRR